MGYVIGNLHLFPLFPNWKAGIRESLEFRTTIIAGLEGVNQYQQRRIAPRRYFEIDVLAVGSNKRLLDAMMFDKGSQEWDLPMWHDRQGLAADLASGSMTIPCETSGVDFAAPGRAVLTRGVNDFEIVNIDSVDSGGINLVSATTNTWTRGTRLYPLRKGRINSEARATEYTTAVQENKIPFVVTEPCDWPADDSMSTYKGLPVWNIRPDRLETRQVGYDRQITVVDNGAGAVSYFDFPGTAFVSANMRWVAKGRDGNALMRSILYYLRGRVGVVWLPTWSDDFKVVSPLASAGVSMAVEWCGYTIFGRAQKGRRDIRIELKNGTVLYRRITASFDNGATETITVDAPFGLNIAVADIKMVSFMCLAQSATDRFDLDHPVDSKGPTILTLPFQGVKPRAGEY